MESLIQAAGRIQQRNKDDSSSLGNDTSSMIVDPFTLTEKDTVAR